jgi:hypothetical protein
MGQLDSTCRAPPGACPSGAVHEEFEKANFEARLSLHRRKGCQNQALSSYGFNLKATLNRVFHFIGARVETTQALSSYGLNLKATLETSLSLHRPKGWNQAFASYGSTACNLYSSHLAGSRPGCTGAGPSFCLRR